MGAGELRLFFSVCSGAPWYTGDALLKDNGFVDARVSVEDGRLEMRRQGVKRDDAQRVREVLYKMINWLRAETIIVHHLRLGPFLYGVWYREGIPHRVLNKSDSIGSRRLKSMSR